MGVFAKLKRELKAEQKKKTASVKKAAGPRARSPGRKITARALDEETRQQRRTNLGRPATILSIAARSGAGAGLQPSNLFAGADAGAGVGKRKRKVLTGRAGPRQSNLLGRQVSL